MNSEGNWPNLGAASSHRLRCFVVSSALKTRKREALRSLQAYWKVIRAELIGQGFSIYRGDKS
jgi:hypothetical protein